MEHQYEVCAWLLHVGNQQCLIILMVFSGFKKLALLFVCVTSLEYDEVVVSLVDYGVPRSVCRVMVAQKLKW